MNMKNPTLVAAALILCAFAPISNAQQKDESGMGLLVMAGGRYDNLRMCVASAAGVKGGIIGDVMLTGRHAVNDHIAMGFNLPVMRPILFGLAFRMLQFEPEMVLDVKKQVSDKIVIITAPSLGISLHYGPDYNSDRKNRSPSFFAAGPIAGVHLGMGFKDENGSIENIIGIKPFYAGLFTREQGRGTVIGGALEFQHAW